MRARVQNDTYHGLVSEQGGVGRSFSLVQHCRQGGGGGINSVDDDTTHGIINTKGSERARILMFESFYIVIC